MMAQFWHFQVFASETLPYAIKHYEREVLRLFHVLDKRLAKRNYLLNDYGITDIATWPWINAYCWTAEISHQFRQLMDDLCKSIWRV